MMKSRNAYLLLLREIVLFLIFVLFWPIAWVAVFLSLLLHLPSKPGSPTGWLIGFVGAPRDAIFRRKDGLPREFGN